MGVPDLTSSQEAGRQDLVTHSEEKKIIDKDGEGIGIMQKKEYTKKSERNTQQIKLDLARYLD